MHEVLVEKKGHDGLEEFELELLRDILIMLLLFVQLKILLMNLFIPAIPLHSCSCNDA